jgi:hypothetical protein
MLMAAGSFQALIIDTFNDTEQAISGVGGAVPPVISSTVAATEAVGGFRTLELVEVLGPGGTLSSSLVVDAGGVTDFLSYSNDSSTSSDAHVIWDANGTGLGGVDLTDGGLSSYLSLEILDIDFGGIDMEFDITDTSANTASIMIDDAAIGIHQVVFSDFTNFGGTDFEMIDSITLHLHGAQAKDLDLDFVFTSGEITPIPEPSTIILLGLGGLGMLGYAWRSRRKNS